MNSLNYPLILAALCFLGSANAAAQSNSTLEKTVAYRAPEFSGKSGDWLNTDGQPIPLFGPDGRKTDRSVVLVDFWEYTCIGCIRTLPAIKDWAARYKDSGLVVVGIHTPEFQFGHDRKNVLAAVDRFNLRYPVLIDSDYKNWNAFHTQFWPMAYLIDADGDIIATHPGEAGIAALEQSIRAALVQANPSVILPPAYGDHTSRIVADQPFHDMTRETYAGSRRGTLADGDYHDDIVTDYEDPKPSLHQDGAITLQGPWLTDAEYVEHNGVSDKDYVALRYHAKEVVAVIKSSGGAFKIYVRQDGRPVARDAAGSDVQYEPDGRSYLQIIEPRAYQIIVNPLFSRHDLTLSTKSPDFRLYSFDFAAS